MDMEYGKAQMEIRILESGKIQKQMDMECIFGKMEIGMKESGEHVSNMEKVQIYFQMAMSTLVITNLENLMGMVSTFGLMDQFMMEISKMD